MGSFLYSMAALHQKHSP